ncbi:SemiSWEET family sugar transporter [Methanofollis ethanolicus]|uniref:SemiSWEET family sugar transporter n=1 Tax=Methanofollis ethanolicus TaxID=488124 RepID=UPI00082D254E|nr:SemiSWEET transporter [Methanofollis ethanolicus]
MDATMLIGFCAGLCTAVSFFPQVARTLRTRSARDFSALMLFLLFTGLILWFVYGALRDDAAIAVTNGVTAAMVAVIGVVKMRSG